MRQVRRQQLAGYVSFLRLASCFYCRAAGLPCLKCVYGSAGYDPEEAAQMFDIVDADHGKLMTAFCCLLVSLVQPGRSYEYRKCRRVLAKRLYIFRVDNGAYHNRNIHHVCC